jgi:inositol transport system substrate-binding protein
MRLKKGLFKVMCIALVLMSVNGCTKSGAKKDKIIIGFSMPSFDDKWLSYMLNAAQEKAKEYTDAEVIFTDAKLDSAKQLGQIENFIAQGASAIIVCPVDSDATAPYTQVCKEAGIPLIGVNRFFANMEDLTGFVGSDSKAAGRLQMEYLGEQMKGKGNLAIIRGGDGHEASRNRTAGVKEIISSKYPDIKVVTEQNGKWFREVGMMLMENWIQTKMEINAVACNNDEMAIGAIMALKEANMLDKVLVAGVDATPDALVYVKSGELTVTVFQNATGQGAGAVEMAYDVANGKTVEKIKNIPFELVTKDNVETYIKKWQ